MIYVPKYRISSTHRSLWPSMLVLALTPSHRNFRIASLMLIIPLLDLCSCVLVCDAGNYPYIVQKTSFVRCHIARCSWKEVDNYVEKSRHSKKIPHAAAIYGESAARLSSPPTAFNPSSTYKQTSRSRVVSNHRQRSTKARAVLELGTGRPGLVRSCPVFRRARALSVVLLYRLARAAVWSLAAWVSLLETSRRRRSIVTASAV